MCNNCATFKNAVVRSLAREYGDVKSHSLTSRFRPLDVISLLDYGKQSRLSLWYSEQGLMSKFPEHSTLRDLRTHLRYTLAGQGCARE